MQGVMLWFNLEKGYGLIRTEEDERLRVARSGFLAGHLPEPRCKGREVSFERAVAEDGPRAVKVVFAEPKPQRRARLRHGRGGRPL